MIVNLSNSNIPKNWDLIWEIFSFKDCMCFKEFYMLWFFKECV